MGPGIYLWDLPISVLYQLLGSSMVTPSLEKSKDIFRPTQRTEDQQPPKFGPYSLLLEHKS